MWKRERESAMVLCMPGMCCVDMVKLCGSCEEQTAEGHDMWAVGGAGRHTLHHHLVVTQEADAEGGPAVAPGNSRQHDGIQLLPLDAVLQLCLGPPPVEPLPLAVGPEADGPGAVSEQLEVGEGVQCGRRKKEWPFHGVANACYQARSSPEGLCQSDGVLEALHRGAGVDHPP